MMHNLMTRDRTINLAAGCISREPRGRFIPFLGGKYFLASRLLPLFPEHRIYVEVFGGSAVLLFRKDRADSEIEVYNDLDGELVNLFTVVRDQYPAFQKRLRWLLYSREWKETWVHTQSEDPVERAVRTWYVYNSSF
ncbi:hypothetical protein GWN43_05875, partial [Candidatus Bathyarchaeota archaeon]|nr:hypothetical protein [Candidatus Bathyarchaeota archaeon]